VPLRPLSRLPLNIPCRKLTWNTARVRMGATVPGEAAPRHQDEEHQQDDVTPRISCLRASGFMGARCGYRIAENVLFKRAPHKGPVVSGPLTTRPQG
jgi:hypothetical protein